jgi:RimJ/RimL family protein N-acetyltransferase
MFTLDGVTLRALELTDIDQLYEWEDDIEINILAGWGPQRSRAAYTQRYENTHSTQPCSSCQTSRGVGLPRP